MKHVYFEKTDSKIEKNLFIFLFSVLSFLSYSQNVSVTATGGTTTGSYATINAAFTAINNGTHTGSIVLSVVANTVEPATPVPLLASAGASNYTDVTIVPVGTRVVTGIPSANRSIIELFGADNVTINGDDPNTAGLRNLSFEVSTGNFVQTAAIRIGSVSTTNECNGINIRNCIIKGGRPSNVNITDNFGIMINGNTTTNMLTAGVTNKNINIDSNEIYRCSYGIACIGTNGSPFSNISIVKNRIGVTANSNEGVGRHGILMSFSSTAAAPSKIEKNEIQVGLPTTTGTTMDCIGIFISDGNPSLKITKNYIHDVVNNNAGMNNASQSLPLPGSGIIATTSCNVAGIQLIGTANTNIEISQNIVRDVISAKKQATLGLDANYGIYLLSFGSARFVHNTVGLIMPNTQGATTNTVSCAALFNTGNLIEYSHNILVNKNVSANAFCIVTTAATIAASTIANNCYYFPNGSCGNSGAPFTLDNWQLATGKDLSSFVENPPFISATDLHIQTSKITQLESGATGSGANQDIDDDIRPGGTSVNNTPDIGADEFDGVKYTPPAFLQVSHTPNTQGCISSSKTVIAVFNTLGNAVDSVMLEYTINGGAKQYLKMNTAATNIYNAVIPSVTPLNAIVTYRVFCVTPIQDSITSNYFSYNDHTASTALWPALVSTPNQACVGSTVSLSYAFSPDPTGFNFPPTVTNPTLNFDIVNLSVGSINNTSTLHSLTGTIGTATGTAGSYSNFRNLDSTLCQLGKSYPVTLTSSSTNNSGKCYFAGFVDFNGDGDFNDANETVFKTIQVKALGNKTEKFSLYIPPSARPGKTCLRIIVSSSPIANSYTNLGSGEIEDYTIKITPLSATWVVNGSSAGSANPTSATLGTIPSSVYLDMVDSNGCTVSTNPISITSSPASMSVTISAPTTACYNTPQIVTGNVTGGCPPYTYTWSNTSVNASSQLITLLTDTVYLTLTVTDKNGTQMSNTKTIYPSNPKPLTLGNPQVICNRGTTRLSITTASTDSGYWYVNPSADPYNYDSVGKFYTTPTISANQTFYVSAFRSNLDSVGKINLTGATVNNQLFLNTGLRMNVQEPVLIKNCAMYMSGIATATINIGLLDKYGTILAQTGNFTPAFAANATLPTIVPLDFLITKIDTGYRLVLLDAVGLTAITRNTSGQAFPYPSTKPIVVTGAYSIPLPTTTDYFYFYNIKVLKNMCVGEKKSIAATVTEPRVPKIYKDLQYTQICKGDSLRLKIFTDTFGNRFVWTKNDVVLQDFSVSPPSDTFKDSVYRIPVTVSTDTGLYRVKLYSTQFCTRDSFSREVRVSFYPESSFITNLFPVNMCIGRNTTLAVNTAVATKFRWYKNNVLTKDTTIGTFDISNATYADTGTYKVVINDSNNCRNVSSALVKVMVFDTPKITMDPVDTTICDGDRYVVKAKAINATNYQWFKDNGIMTFYTKDSIVIYNSILADSGRYRIVASSYPGCPDAVSNFAKLTVNPSSKILGYYPPDIKVCEGQKIKLVSRTKDVLNVQWYKGGNPLGVTADSFVQNNANLTHAGVYMFKAQALNKCASKFSDTMNVKVVKRPLLTGTLPNVNLCSGSQYKGGFATTNVKMYQWYRNNVPLQSMTDSMLFIRFLDKADTGRYFVRVNSDSVCPEISSNPFSIFITLAPVIDVQPVGDTACLGADILLDATVRNFSGFQWKKDNANITGAVGSTYNIANLSQSKEGKYWLVVNGIAPCTSIISDTAYVRFRSGATNASASLVSVYDAIEQCTDNSGWTYYSPQNDETKYVFAVRKNGNNMVGKADVVVRPSTYQSISNSANGYTAMLMLKRFWNYKVVSGDFTSPIDVKFYYNTAERDELEAKKTEIMNLYTGQLELENTSIDWFRTDSLPFTNPRLNDIQGNKFLFKTIALSNFTEGSENGIRYIEFQDITNISGGSGVYKFKGAPRVFTSILDGSEPFRSSVFPNPSNGSFYLHILTKKLGNMSVSIVNALGQEVYRHNFELKSTSTENLISVPELSNGFYQLIMTKDDFTSTMKLQIEK